MQGVSRVPIAHAEVHGLYILLWGLVELEEELVHEVEAPGREQYYRIYALYLDRDCIPALGNPSPWCDKSYHLDR